MAPPTASALTQPRIELSGTAGRQAATTEGSLKLQRILAAYIVPMVIGAMAAACSNDTTDPNDPDNPNALGLAVAVRTDPSTFQQTGEFVLELIPSTREGQSLVNESWTISTTITEPQGVAPEFLSQQVLPPDTTPSDVALLVDNSESMLQNDPDRLRVAAANLLWNTLLEQQHNNVVSLLYFGFGPLQPTPGFSATRLLQTWTSDRNVLSGILDTLTVGTSSRIYSSALDVVEWFDTTTSADHRRVLLLLTDGKLNREGGATVSEVLSAAQRAGVNIGTVGLGPASDRGPTTEGEAVRLLQELANGSGGLYAGAATPERLASTLLSLTAWSSTGALLATFKLSPVPPSGARVSGNIQLQNQTLGKAQGLWSFIAP